VWLQDVLGLCHSRRIRAGEARLTVLPAQASVDCIAHLLGAGGNADEARTAHRLPTEGSLHLREYQFGDDVRRIHWLRSLMAQQIVVRLPDELPPDQPSVHLVLDTFHPGLASPASLTCRGPDDLLDALVRVWLGVARALVERGIRVTAVASVDTGGEQSPQRAHVSRRALTKARELGARVGWQSAVRPAELLGDQSTVVVSHRLPNDDTEGNARWIVVPGALWTARPEPDWRVSMLMPHPLGSADNRRSRRSRVRAVRDRERADHDAFRWLCEHSQARRAGQLVARPAGPLQAQLEVLR